MRKGKKEEIVDKLNQEKDITTSETRFVGRKRRPLEIPLTALQSSNNCIYNL